MLKSITDLLLYLKEENDKKQKQLLGFAFIDHHSIDKFLIEKEDFKYCESIYEIEEKKSENPIKSLFDLKDAIYNKIIDRRTLVFLSNIQQPDINIETVKNDDKIVYNKIAIGLNDLCIYFGFNYYFDCQAYDANDDCATDYLFFYKNTYKIYEFDDTDRLRIYIYLMIENFIKSDYIIKLLINKLINKYFKIFIKEMEDDNNE